MRFTSQTKNISYNPKRVIFPTLEFCWFVFFIVSPCPRKKHWFNLAQTCFCRLGGAEAAIGDLKETQTDNEVIQGLGDTELIARYRFLIGLQFLRFIWSCVWFSNKRQWQFCRLDSVERSVEDNASNLADKAAVATSLSVSVWILALTLPVNVIAIFKKLVPDYSTTEL